MDRRAIIVVNWQRLLQNPGHQKQLVQKSRISIGRRAIFVGTETSVTVRLRDSAGGIAMDSEAKVCQIGDCYYLQSRIIDRFSDLKLSDGIVYVFAIAEGSSQNARIVLCPTGGSFFTELEAEQPTLRLSSYDLPPSDFELIDSTRVMSAVYSCLLAADRELLSERSRRFLHDPHILTQMFAHVMSLKSSDHINYISHLRIISDNLRQMLLPRIRSIKRDHKGTWSGLRGKQVTFADGGMSRIIALPGSEPMGIRVGFYSVNLGCEDLQKRESWKLYSYVIGDVLNDHSAIEAENYQTDPKRLQEAARYLLEPLSILRHLDAEKRASDFVFMHGPLENAFETYDELAPYHLPGVGEQLLEECGVTRADIEAIVSSIPNDFRGNAMWNQCIPVYLFILKKVFAASVPVVGVVERANSQAFSRQVLNELVREKTIPESTKRKIWTLISKYDIGDEFLFGCVLEEGEYINPISLAKNLRRRAHDKWQPVIEQFPIPLATMLKTSSNRFPFRVEINGKKDSYDLMNLLYHTSLLLPNYAFPVGVDIADRYARIPDWLSKGVSANLTAAILSRTLQTGNERLLRQVRQLLARSPRDFFYRPSS